MRKLFIIVVFGVPAFIGVLSAFGIMAALVLLVLLAIGFVEN